MILATLADEVRNLSHVSYAAKISFKEDKLELKCHD